MLYSVSGKLASYVDALRPIIYINHFDFDRIDNIIADIGKNVKIYEWTNGLQDIDFFTKQPKLGINLESFLKVCLQLSTPSFVVLKDVHNYLDDPVILSLLKHIALKTMKAEGFNVTIFIISTKFLIPQEIEKLTTVFDIPYPDYKEIKDIILDYANSFSINIAKETLDELSISFKGLSEFEIRQILNLAYQENGSLDENDKELILKEKEQTIKKSGILEVINFNETMESIGGLSGLKNYLLSKSYIYNNLGKAKEFGIDLPKGILILGLPGCGKSITAKATATLFNVPLLRLDVGKLLGKYVGESEENLRRAIKTAEAVSPSVLWIDELEKAFAGIGGYGGASDTTTRLFGNFLTWMQEKESTVYVVATSNDISKLPPEFLRKGRFDELFFVDLPKPEERKQIFEIHLKKRKKYNRDIDIFKLIDLTNGYSGADIESVIIEALENCFIDNEPLSTERIIKVINTTKSISITLKDKIDEMRKLLVKYDIRNASE
ncbi:MAG: AAA family ATPase [Nitrososphaeria archaeon]